MELGKASRVPVLGSRAAARRGAKSVATASQAQQLLGASVCTMGLLSGGRARSRQPRSVDRERIQRPAGGGSWDPCLAPRSVGGPAPTPGSDRRPEGWRHVVPSGPRWSSVEPGLQVRELIGGGGGDPSLV